MTLEARELLNQVVPPAVRVLGEEFHIDKADPIFWDRFHFATQYALLFAAIDARLLQIGKPARYHKFREAAERARAGDSPQ